MSTFQYDADLLQRYPQVVGGVILARDLTNGPTPAGLLQMYQAEQEQVKQRIDTTPLSQITSLAAWRSAIRAFGVDPTQYRSAAEALLRRLTKKGDIPSINLLVDIGNLVSIRYALPVAVFDSRALQGAVTVHFAQLQYPQTDLRERENLMPPPTVPDAGNFTRIIPNRSSGSVLGQAEVEQPEVGEVVFTDDTGLVIARRWCWRQSEQSAAQLDTTAAIITVEAQHANSRHDIETALMDLQELLSKYAGGTFTNGIVDAQHPVISDKTAGVHDGNDK